MSPEYVHKIELWKIGELCHMLQSKTRPLVYQTDQKFYYFFFSRAARGSREQADWAEGEKKLDFSKNNSSFLPLTVNTSLGLG